MAPSERPDEEVRHDRQHVRRLPGRIDTQVQEPCWDQAEGMPRAAEFNLLPRDLGGYSELWLSEFGRQYVDLHILQLRRVTLLDSNLRSFRRWSLPLLCMCCTCTNALGLPAKASSPSPHSVDEALPQPNFSQHHRYTGKKRHSNFPKGYLATGSSNQKKGRAIAMEGSTSNSGEESHQSIVAREDLTIDDSENKDWQCLYCDERPCTCPNSVGTCSCPPNTTPSPSCVFYCLRIVSLEGPQDLVRNCTRPLDCGGWSKCGRGGEDS